MLFGLRNSARRDIPVWFGPTRYALNNSARRNSARRIMPGRFFCPFFAPRRALRVLPAGGQQCQTESEQHLPGKQRGITIHNGGPANKRRSRRHKKSAPKIQAQGLNADSENQHQAPGP